MFLDIRSHNLCLDVPYRVQSRCDCLSVPEKVIWHVERGAKTCNATERLLFVVPLQRVELGIDMRSELLPPGIRNDWVEQCLHDEGCCIHDRLWKAACKKNFLLYFSYFDESSTEKKKLAGSLGNTMGRLWTLNCTSSDESDSAGEEEIAIVRSKKPIASNSEPTADTLSMASKKENVKVQETSHNEVADDVADDVEDEAADDVEDDEEEEIPLRRPTVKETAKATVASAKSTDVLMEGNFNKYGKWKMEVVKEEFIPCTLSFGCILEARHPELCICPFDESKSRQCKPTSFVPPKRVQRPKKRAKTEDNTVVLAAVEIPDTFSKFSTLSASAPQVEVSSSDDEDRIVASLVSSKKGPATSVMRTESTGASSAGPSTVETIEDKTCNIKELAKLVASFQKEDSYIELKLMHAIAKKYQLQPGNVAK